LHPSAEQRNEELEAVDKVRHGVSGFGARVQVLGIRVEGLGMRVKGSAVSGFGFRV